MLLPVGVLLSPFMELLTLSLVHPSVSRPMLSLSSADIVRRNFTFLWLGFALPRPLTLAHHPPSCLLTLSGDVSLLASAQKLCVLLCRAHMALPAWQGLQC